MMKTKITALITALMMLINIGAFAAFDDINVNTGVGNAVKQLVQLGIINGYPDGTFRPEDTLTRGQFAKIAVCMLGEEQQAQSRSANAIFSDVPTDHWASGYINYIAEHQIINGYPDGTFGAEDTINYAQVLTILIRLLGYTGEDVAYKWPDGYISKAQSLGITSGISFGTYENITRGNAAYVIYNTLLADKKEGSSLSLLSSSSVKDVVIYADNSINASLAIGNIETTNGVYKLADNSNITSEVYGRLGTLYLDGEKRATAFVPENETVRSVTLSSATVSGDGKRVEIGFTENTAAKSESLSGSAPVYYEGKASTLSQSAAKIEPGSEALLLYANDGSFARMYLKESTLSGPRTVATGYSQIYSFFNIVNSTAMKVIRDGKNASLSEIQAYDVVYYMAGNNTLYAYTDKASGVYEEAYPLKSNVTSVKVGGKEYPLATQTAIGKMNTSDGAFELGDRVTLLFGRNGEVVDVVNLAAVGSLDLVVLTKSYKEVSQETDTLGKTTNYITVVLPDGGEVTYEADRDYSDYVGNVMKVKYENDVAKLTVVPHTNIYGKFDSSIPSLGEYWLSENCAILELVKNSAGGATVKKIELRDIVTDSLTKNQVIHAEMSGALKDITFLYVTDVTKTDADFGVVTEVNNNKYTILIGEKTTQIETAVKLERGCGVEIQQTSDGQIAKRLTNVGTASKIEGYSGGRIRINGKNYILSDYVKVYGGTYANTYTSMSLSELANGDNIQHVTLYSDRSLSSGGIVRVIVVKTKN
ncbi:MAG: S-layer homology domain-containing protein [Clostridia bacterium]|nr:S-layer homology domain-containing protein [Clostridia bacterium]